MAKTSYLPNPARIKVFGCGGGGCNAVTRMVREEIQGVEFIALNTDAQALAITEAPVRVQLGERVTRGLGAGGDHTMGQKAAEESRDDIRELVSGSDMVFVTAGMGGGTGTGSAPIVAEEAKKSGALTIAVVTKPFGFEGSHRMKTAKEGISKLLGKVDTLIIIPNDRLLELCDAKTGVDTAFRMADNVLQQGVKAISEVITVPGTINLDFADVKAVMKDAGPAWMSIGRGAGKNRAIDAAREALASPLLDVSVGGARGVLFNVVGPSDLSLYEVNEAAEVIRKAVDPDANIIFGVGSNTNMGNDVHITLIATGFNVATEDGEGDDELTAKLRGIKNEEELDVPSFLRRPLFSQSRQPAPEPSKSNRPPTRSTWR
ncbi:cell division protein FtsZ [Dehalogenimonas etheniformans]|uniref:Cell division protein FtsZ n=1 Tax=Dehalogenimonas etheniformans TaxID=1536648 RepID=A0A2P5P7T8_9CHLR|nr:cell division protein FtsZ [Dehalogenimonas etheniformans]PPD58361.1 cell division protein FtsZ [Dehalogenimonas etheniformans]QNT76934.1 cell division protein FtsZ [Dehalogenimonas etheniformans]